LNDFRAQVFVQSFERAEIARCQHCNADNFKILQANYMLIRLLNAQMMTKINKINKCVKLRVEIPSGC